MFPRVLVISLVMVPCTSFADIPLLPPIGNNRSKVNFVVHWLNNKELHFTLESESILQEMARQSRAREAATNSEDESDPSEAPTEVDAAVEEEITSAHAGTASEAVVRGGFLRSHTVLPWHQAA